MLSRFDRMSVCDGRTDRRTPLDSKHRVYAKHRASKNVRITYRLYQYKHMHIITSVFSYFGPLLLLKMFGSVFVWKIFVIVSTLSVCFFYCFIGE